MTSRPASGLAGIGGGAHLDVVAQARAALAPDGQIVYLVTTMHIGGPPQSEPLPPPATTEQWSTAAPPRWRIAETVPDPSKTPDTISGPHGAIVGPEQSSYANGTEEDYAQRLNTLDVTTGFSHDGPPAQVPGPLGSDPLFQARSMLDAGLLHDAGNAVVNGKTVRRLVGEEPRPRAVPGRSGWRPPYDPAWPVTYDVNPDTFAPVQVTIQTRFAIQAPSSEGPILVFDVNHYERLPLNDQTAKLLTIQTIGTPTVYHHQVHPTQHP